ncbi:MAG: SprT-like domain-containing protein [bacterium]|nr:SprT-like domain-containing protein [bacterium]
MQATRKNTLEWLANTLLEEWGLTEKGWRFVWGNRKRSFGVCRSRAKTIELSLYLLPTINDDSAEDTIRHEIAHALDFDDRGRSDHSYKWKAWAIKVGADPTSCKRHDNPEVLEQLAKESRYTLYCPDGHTFPSHKKQKVNRRTKRCCSTCHGEGKGLVVLEQRQNY